MDTAQLHALISKSPNLKHRFLGCFPADTVPTLPSGTFQIINTASLGERGEHWLLLLRGRGELVFYDSFARPIETSFPALFNRLCALYNNNVVLTQFYPTKSLIQSHNTSLCGLYCVFFAQFFYSKAGIMPLNATEQDILRFASDTFGGNFGWLV